VTIPGEFANRKTLLAHTNAAGAFYYLSNMVFRQKRVCPYCIAGAVIKFASAAIFAPVAIKALKNLFA
jgi:hypothetical protein